MEISDFDTKTKESRLHVYLKRQDFGAPTSTTPVRRDPDFHTRFWRRVGRCRSQIRDDQNHKEFQYRLGRARVARARTRGNSRQSIFSSRWRTHEPLVSSQEIFLRIRSLDLGTGSRIPDPAMKLVGIPGVSRTCTSHRP